MRAGTSLLTEVCHDVLIEPDLQPITSELLLSSILIARDDACLDIAPSDFWEVVLRGLILMYVYLTLLPPQIENPSLLPAIEGHENMNE